LIFIEVSLISKTDRASLHSQIEHLDKSIGIALHNILKFLKCVILLSNFIFSFSKKSYSLFININSSCEV